MNLHVRIVTPHTTARPSKLAGLEDLRGAFPGLRLSHVGLDAGPVSVEGSFDEALCAPGVVQRCIEAAREGVDQIVIDCMGDPGLEAAREAVSACVLGSCETTLHVAAMLGHKFSVLTVLERVRSLLERRALVYGLRDKLASVHAVNVPVLEIETDEVALASALFERARMAIEQDHADTIVLGCTGFLGLSQRLSSALREAGYAVPVLDPLRTALATAVSLGSLGLTHSPQAFPSVNFGKPMRGFASLAQSLSQGAQRT